LRDPVVTLLSVGPSLAAAKTRNSEEFITVSIRITAIRLSGGNTHEHIVHLWWTTPSTGETGDNSRAEIVAWIENENGKAYVEDHLGHRVDVRVVVPAVGAKYLRTIADGVWTDNLLALPRR